MLTPPSPVAASPELLPGEPRGVRSGGRICLRARAHIHLTRRRMDGRVGSRLETLAITSEKGPRAAALGAAASLRPVA